MLGIEVRHHNVGAGAELVEDEPALLVQLASGCVLRVARARTVRVDTSELVLENGGERARFPLGEVYACSTEPFLPVPD